MQGGQGEGKGKLEPFSSHLCTSPSLACARSQSQRMCRISDSSLHLLSAPWLQGRAPCSSSPRTKLLTAFAEPGLSSEPTGDARQEMGGFYSVPQPLIKNCSGSMALEPGVFPVAAQRLSRAFSQPSQLNLQPAEEPGLPEDSTGTWLHTGVSQQCHPGPSTLLFQGEAAQNAQGHLVMVLQTRGSSKGFCPCSSPASGASGRALP